MECSTMRKDKNYAFWGTHSELIPGAIVSDTRSYRDGVNENIPWQVATSQEIPFHTGGEYRSRKDCIGFGIEVFGSI